GQPDFAHSLPGTEAASFKAPSAVAIGPDGDIFVSDTGNNRVLQFGSDSSIASLPLRVIGQQVFDATAPPSVVSAQTLSAPQGLFVTPSSSLYVADSGANRVLLFVGVENAPQAGAAASLVLGQ